MKKRDVSIASIKHAAMVTTLSACLLFFSACTRHNSPDDYQGSQVTETNRSTVLDRGVQALRQHTPGELIRGTLDATYDLHDFQVAAEKLALQNSKAAYIMGWLSENGVRAGSDHAPKEAINIRQTDMGALGFEQNKVLAGAWYTIASQGGLGAGSVQMALLLQQATGPNREKCLALANDFLRKGMGQGDAIACVDLGYSYAYGLGVKANSSRAWDLFSKIIYSKDAGDANTAIIYAILAWKDDKIKPSAHFTRGYSDAYSFVQSYDPAMTNSALDGLYQYHGFTPDPNPQWRLEIANKIRAKLTN